MPDMKRLSFFLFVAAVSFASCKKSSDAGSANVRVINVSPNSSAFDFNVNGSLQVGNVTYGTGSTYRPIPANTPSIAIVSGGSTLFNSAIGVSANKYYSLYFYDSTSILKLSFLEEERPTPAAGKCLIRFLHFYKGAVTVDIKQASGANMFLGRTMVDHMNNGSLIGYTSFDPGTFSINTFVAGTSVQLFQFPNFTAEAGKRYTLVLRGFSSVSTGPQSLQLVPMTDE